MFIAMNTGFEGVKAAEEQPSYPLELSLLINIPAVTFTSPVRPEGH